jgi:hypothetical protein
MSLLLVGTQASFLSALFTQGGERSVAFREGAHGAKLTSEPTALAAPLLAVPTGAPIPMSAAVAAPSLHQRDCTCFPSAPLHWKHVAMQRYEDLSLLRTEASVSVMAITMPSGATVSEIAFARARANGSMP